ncbi:MAG: MFS transporter [Candidatus Algichlamydia australiensis]|nr:MFS transporter [Chlamydiales bacterium]
MSFFKKKSTRIKAFFNSLPFRKTEGFATRNAIHFHNLTQFGGAMNDNIFKFLILFFLISIKGVDDASRILFWLGLVYVAPFLLFSSAAGVLADRFSKSRIIVTMKVTEIVIIILAFFAFAAKSEISCYALMFLLSMQSAFFGPPKYSIIPELVEKNRISKANGWVTSFTYLAIIVGTFLASFVSDILNKNYLLSVNLCLVVAILGFITSLFIPYTKPKGTKKKINPLFVREIWRTMVGISERPHLFVSVIGAGFFLFVGAYIQLSIVPFAIQSLKMDEQAGGYLFLTTALGIAVGAFLAGRVVRKRIELGIPCVAGVLMGFGLIFLGLFANSLTAVITILVILGFFGGLFIVPFETYIQAFSPEKRIGQIVAAANFLGFLGVALAPFAIAIINGLLGLSMAKGYVVVGFITLIATLLIMLGLSRATLHFLSRFLVLPFCRPRFVKNPLNKKGNFAILLPGRGRVLTWFLMGISSDVELFVLKNRRSIWDFLYFFTASYHFYYYKRDPKKAMDRLLASDRMRKQKGSISLIAFPFESEKTALELVKKASLTQEKYRLKRDGKEITFQKI